MVGGEERREENERFESRDWPADARHGRRRVEGRARGRRRRRRGARRRGATLGLEDEHGRQRGANAPRLGRAWALLLGAVAGCGAVARLHALGREAISGQQLVVAAHAADGARRRHPVERVPALGALEARQVLLWRACHTWKEACGQRRREEERREELRGEERRGSSHVSGLPREHARADSPREGLRGGGGEMRRSAGERESKRAGASRRAGVQGRG